MKSNVEITRNHDAISSNVLSPFPSRVNCTFQKVNGQIVLDQIRTVDKTRLVKRLGSLTPTVGVHILAVLNEMFQK